MKDLVVARGYRPVDRDQRFLLPPDMREWLPADHLVWFLLDVVAALDTSALHTRPRRHEQGAATGSRAGRAGYDPDMLLGLLIYAYAGSHTSSRRIERLCHTDVAFRVLCAGDIPDHTVIARFRQGHQEAFTALFAQVLRLCAKAGLGQVGTVAIDGSKFAGNASTDANHDREWFTRVEREARERTAAAAAADAAEDDLFGNAGAGDGGGGSGGDRVPAGWSVPGGRGARLRECLEALEAETAAVDTHTAQQAARAQDSVTERQATVDKLRAEQQAKIDKFEAARAAQAADPLFHLRPSSPPKPLDEAVRVRRAEQRLARAQERAARLGETGETGETGGESRTGKTRGGEPKRPVRNLTDPDSRLMKTRRGWVQGYNAQFAVTADQLVLATQVTQDPFDLTSFTPMMNAAITAAGDIAAARDPAAASKPYGGIGMVLADAGYASDANLTAEGPDRLIALGKSRDHARAAREHPTAGDPPPTSSAREAMDHRLRTLEGHRAYTRRGATVEPGIGNLKKITTTICRRGLAAATSEITLIATVHNLLKLHRNAAVAV